LTVQNKFLDIFTLEQSFPLWVYGLSEKQLSFLLRGGCDTLLTPLNLASYFGPICSLCQSIQATFLLAVPLPLIKGYTLDDMALFCRLSFTTLRRIYHHVANFMLTFLVARQMLVPSVIFHLMLHLATLTRPHLVLVSTDSIVLLELSVVTNTQHHLLAAKTRKEDHYG